MSTTETAGSRADVDIAAAGAEGGIVRRGAEEGGRLPDDATPPRIFPRGRPAILLLLVVAAAFVIRFDALRNDAPAVPPFGDGHNYQVIAAALADGDGFVRPIEHERQGRDIATAEYPPALPVLLAAAHKVGVDGEQGQRTILCAVGALTVGLVGVAGCRLGRRLPVGRTRPDPSPVVVRDEDGTVLSVEAPVEEDPGGDPAQLADERWAGVVGMGAAVVAAVHPALVNTDVSLASESLAACLGAAVVVAALAVWDQGNRRRWLGLGALLGVGCLVRAEFLLLVPILLGGLAWRQSGLVARRAGDPGRIQQAIGPALVGLVACVVVLAPWTARNAVTFGDFVPVSNNLGSVLRGANCDLAYHGQFRGLWVTNVGAAGESQVDPEGACFSGFAISEGVDEADAAADLRQAGIDYALEHKGELPGVVGARLGRAVGLYRFDQQANFARAEGRDIEREKDGTRTFQVLAVVGLLGLVVSGWRHRERVIPLAVLLAVLITVAVTYGNPRFRAAAEPSVVLLAAVALADLAASVRTRLA